MRSHGEADGRVNGVAPALSTWRASGRTRAVALVLHGGAEHGETSVRPWGLAYLRMRQIALAVHGASHRDGCEVRLLRNRVRGWNAPGEDPVLDARWAMARVTAEHPDTPVVLIGHSMGGRVALRIADDPAVAGVCALAPWTPGGEPVWPVRGRTVLVAHGLLDGMTGPAASHAYAKRADAEAARIARFEIAHERHAMLRRPAVWARLVRTFTRHVLGFATDEHLERAWSAPLEQRLRIPL